MRHPLDRLVILAFCMLSLLSACCTQAQRIPQPEQVPVSPAPVQTQQQERQPAYLASETITAAALPMVLTTSPRPDGDIKQLATLRSSDDPIQEAIIDLAARLGITIQEIRIESVINDEFPAGDLGCQSSGASRPIPALVSGQSITLETAGTYYLYHARRGEIVFCGEQ